ncbi:hypothetical protein [Streptomyces sp. NBC_00073]|uniref:hypothetical protein n=1 Tax=Streptomyces sp. NBC_00073 TaxID=2975640 RepID=UPI002F9132E5
MITATAVGAGMDEKNTVRAVAIDHKAVLRSPGRAHDGIADFLQWLDEHNISFVLLTTDSLDAEATLKAAGLPAPALHLCRDDIPGRPARGSGAWLLTVADRLKLRTNQIALVGTSEWDWRTGINAGVVHVHARWASHVRDNKGMLTLSADEPADAGELLEHFLLDEPRWAFSHDDTARSLKIRSLLPPNVRFPQAPGRTFELQDVFTRGRTITVGTQDARDILMLRLLSSAYLDGTLPHRSLFCVYPSSSPGQVSQQLAGFLTNAKVLVGSYYREDLLERVTRAPDTSLERVKRNRGQATTADISIAAQARTVRINPKYRGKIKGKTVVIFDDFTTEGTSIEWARTLLASAEVAQVIALTIGKYGSRHTSYQLRPGTAINPFTVNDVTVADFVNTTGTGGAGEGPTESLTTTMNHFVISAQVAEAMASDAALRRPIPAGSRWPMSSCLDMRQEHLAEILTDIQPVYPLAWRAEEFVPEGEDRVTALWWITLPGQAAEQWYDTDEAERLLATICKVAGVIWYPAGDRGEASPD